MELTTDHDTDTQNATQGAPAAYETAKGCLLLGGLALGTALIIALAILTLGESGT